MSTIAVDLWGVSKEEGVENWLLTVLARAMHMEAEFVLIEAGVLTCRKIELGIKSRD